MSTRDEELDRVQRELEAIASPPRAIDRPDEINVADSQLCWRDGHRVCGSDCVAYDRDSEDIDRCRVLVLKAETLNTLRRVCAALQENLVELRRSPCK